jgi:TolA-binding protein
MNALTGSKTRLLAAGALAALLTAPCISTAQNIQGRLIRKDSGAKIEGSISWDGAAREYTVQGPGFITRIPEFEIVDVQVPKPAGLDALAAQVQAGRHAGTEQPLLKIMKDYEMLKWDTEAARLLAQTYLGLNKLREAEEMCEKVFRSRPQSRTSGDLARAYWDILERAKKETKLRAALQEASRVGGREVAAVAQVKLGDIERAAGDPRKALTVGYLRTVILFKDIRTVQPEALLKAAQCFQELGQGTYAEEMRKRLIEGFPQSREAAEARTGT